MISLLEKQNLGKTRDYNYEAILRNLCTKTDYFQNVKLNELGLKKYLSRIESLLATKK